jgi:ABC-type transporter Mla MlaB component
MLRIWSEDPSGPEASQRLRLEGQVREPWLGELERALAEALARGTALRVDLAGVSFVDARGVELLRSLRKRNVQLENCSPFTAEQLRS